MSEKDKDQAVIDALKERYFRLVAKEDIGKSNSLTKEIDYLESEIKKLQLKVAS